MSGHESSPYPAPVMPGEAGAPVLPVTPGQETIPGQILPLLPEANAPAPVSSGEAPAEAPSSTTEAIDGARTQSKSRLAVRVMARIANGADRFSDNMAKRRTTSELVSDKKDEVTDATRRGAARAAKGARAATNASKEALESTYSTVAGGVGKAALGTMSVSLKTKDSLVKSATERKDSVVENAKGTKMMAQTAKELFVGRRGQRMAHRAELRDKAAEKATNATKTTARFAGKAALFGAVGAALPVIGAYKVGEKTAKLGFAAGKKGAEYGAKAKDSAIEATMYTASQAAKGATKTKEVASSTKDSVIEATMHGASQTLKGVNKTKEAASAAKKATIEVAQTGVEEVVKVTVKTDRSVRRRIADARIDRATSKRDAHLEAAIKAETGAQTVSSNNRQKMHERKAQKYEDKLVSRVK